MTGAELDARYARQARFAGIGTDGQERLLRARAVIVGVGALGCAIANHLARAGVGSLTLIDRDIVDRSNLQRQMLFDEADAAAGTPKAIAAAARLAAVNGGIEIVPRVADLNAFNAERLLAGADIVLDGTDNFGARYLINEYCVKHDVPWVYGGAVGASGMTLTVVPGATPCLRCLFPSMPPGGALDTCETAGVLAPIVDTIASMQAIEAIKLLAGRAEALHGSLLQIDLWQNQWQSLAVAGARNPDCPVCAGRRFEALEGNAEDEAATVSLCGRNTVQVMPGRPLALDLRALEPRLGRAGGAELTAYSLRLHLPGGITFVLFEDGRALVIGTEEAQTARRIYAELLGE
ncbi:ThiF family adenylyltransferase [Cohnella cellulosilytica]|uniref:ThiF family adenylyltransferase n=1 Tax=Cohnella cellulosilytica TaxID=986710 RepID=A0ABW2FAJ6_9BACL